MDRTVAGKFDDLLRFQSVLANSSPDKRPGFDECDCEDALYAAALLKPKASERWILVTSAYHNAK